MEAKELTLTKLEMKKIFYLAILLLGICAVSSCSKDDDDDNIHGKWTLVKDYLIDKYCCHLYTYPSPTRLRRIS
ncbi:MAG: hypothetical protein K2L23_04460, partial [Odoribacter sp.]|nr:hypothetical protein [Odoribacter sp.]